jgi:hypothetical protein
VILALKSTIVKEQRVNGNKLNKNNYYLYLRYTLKDFERNYPVVFFSGYWFPRKESVTLRAKGDYNLSKQIDQRINYSTQSNFSVLSSNNISLNPWFITGFADAEASFIISITKSSTNRSGWSVQPYFKISLHQKDKYLLEKCQCYFKGAGKIVIAGKGRDSLSYVISSKEQIMSRVLPHFDKYPLLTQKRVDYELFKRVIYIMNSKRHLTEEGLQEIVNNKASLNLGLSDSLKVAFPKTIAVPKHLFDYVEIPHPQWLVGFTEGEGCFFVSISKTSTELGYNVRIRFILTQHLRDEQLLKSLVSYLGCGSFRKEKPKLNTQVAYFSVTRFEDNYEKIRGFFSKYPLLGVKAQDFNDWCKVSEIIKNKAHLTKEGLDEIIQIKERMNKGRNNVYDDE